MYIRYRISLIIMHTFTQSAHKLPVDTLNICKEAASRELCLARKR